MKVVSRLGSAASPDDMDSYRGASSGVRREERDEDSLRGGQSAAGSSEGMQSSSLASSSSSGELDVVDVDDDEEEDDVDEGGPGERSNSGSEDSVIGDDDGDDSQRDLLGMMDYGEGGEEGEEEVEEEQTTRRGEEEGGGASSMARGHGIIEQRPEEEEVADNAAATKDATLPLSSSHTPEPPASLPTATAKPLHWYMNKLDGVFLKSRAPKWSRVFLEIQYLYKKNKQGLSAQDTPPFGPHLLQEIPPQCILPPSSPPVFLVSPAERTQITAEHRLLITTIPWLEMIPRSTTVNSSSGGAAVRSEIGSTEGGAEGQGQAPVLSYRRTDSLLFEAIDIVLSQDEVDNMIDQQSSDPSLHANAMRVLESLKNLSSEESRKVLAMQYTEQASDWAKQKAPSSSSSLNELQEQVRKQESQIDALSKTAIDLQEKAKNTGEEAKNMVAQLQQQFQVFELHTRRLVQGEIEVMRKFEAEETLARKEFGLELTQKLEQMTQSADLRDATIDDINELAEDNKQRLNTYDRAFSWLLDFEERRAPQAEIAGGVGGGGVKAVKRSADASKQDEEEKVEQGPHKRFKPSGDDEISKKKKRKEEEDDDMLFEDSSSLETGAKEHRGMPYSETFK